ncbi:MAG: HAMP domain-containing histidine kinase [Lachnospiraceae bacterium]|nr:HAMP domain-containing histidine kinase [Lachnospiraceae bacterium]
MKYYFRIVAAGVVLYIIGAAALLLSVRDSEVPWGLIAGLLLFGIALLLGAYFYGLYVRKKIVIPLENMRIYAGKIAEGDITDLPEEDGHNDFGEFAESFGIVCDELEKSRDRERQLCSRQRDFVTSLGQELKTPITGIRLTAEHLRAGLTEDLDLKKAKEIYAKNLDSIYEKAGTIEELLTELVTSALDDLGEVRVSCADENAQVLEDMMRKYDDRGMISAYPVPDVLINIDTRRMSQVIENIIVNSYQYANTPIDVGYLVTDDFLQMMITDHGPGVASDEIDHITDRFYRSRLGAGSKDGSGLGLYTARLLMTKMGGELLVANTGTGLCISLLIPLS